MSELSGFLQAQLAASRAGAADLDPLETGEWLDALASLLESQGAERARFVLTRVLAAARDRGLDLRALLGTPYCNTVPVDAQPPYPGDLALEARLTAWVRWNALAMVVRANRDDSGLGGHIASFASAADLFETGFHHVFRGPDAPGGGDLLFVQPHSAPGIYARAFLEGRLARAHLENFRRELGTPLPRTAHPAAVTTHGLSAYPHPWLMPDFWQFPTGSMGLGPLQAVYQARFMRYLEHRGLADPAVRSRRVWGVFGDGEMDEPESIAGLALAAREGLDNLTFVVNCNLQRLDGPVRGNGRIVDELEGVFAGAGWHVVKLLWGSGWDPLFAADTEGWLRLRMQECVDGHFQAFKARDGAFGRERFFGRYPALAALVEGWDDARIAALTRGGHDPVKIHAAMSAAMQVRGRPTVILAKTVKGFGMGRAGESLNVTHQQKKLDREALFAFRERFALPLTDAQVESLDFHRPDDDAPEMRYLQARRAALGGALPQRRDRAPLLAVSAARPGTAFDTSGAAGRAISTTMAAVQVLGRLARDPGLGARVVPVVADEARTFGMQQMFRQLGIYAPHGQLYEPEDLDTLLSYRESRDGQILEEGITEAGAMASWIAAATAYANHGTAMLPVYIYYSMFGFQRVGDLIWAAADARARGFLLGATAGRTTLNGEGLQHQDGSSLVIAATVPNCRAYDPAFADEVGVLLQAGARAMLAERRDEFWYLTLTNENHPQRALPHGAESGVVRGLYCLEPAARDGRPRVRLLGGGAIVVEVLAAAQALRERGIDAEVWVATSYSELAREASAWQAEVRRQRHAHPGDGSTPQASAAPPWLVAQLGGDDAPVIAASDWVRAWPEAIRPWVTAPYVTLGTDGFGASDTRAALREHFGVSRRAIALAALDALSDAGALAPDRWRELVDTLRG